MPFSHRRLLFTLLPFLLASVSCQVNPTAAIRDLAAIHDPISWQPMANSEVESLYKISDHRQLEEAILVNLGGINSQQFSEAFELSSWMLIMLTHDENPAARRQSLAILGNLSGAWISQNQACDYPEGSLDIETGIHLLANASNGAELEAACLSMLNSATPDVFVAARIMAALGRTMHLFAVDEKRNLAVTSLALRMAKTAIVASLLDSDSDISQAAQQTLDILDQHSQ